MLRSLHNLFLPAYARDFTAAMVEDVQWKWSWRGNSIAPSSLTSHCRTCGLPVQLFVACDEYDREHTDVYCPSCNRTERKRAELREFVVTQIEADVAQNRWRAPKTISPASGGVASFSGVRIAEKTR